MDEKIISLIRAGEDRLMERILFYAHRQDYVRYTSTLQEAWRISIQGLSEALCEALISGRDVELTPDENFSDDPAAFFGVVEAQRHRRRGVTYSMFMGLFKYYREAYADLLQEGDFSEGERKNLLLYFSRVFDRIEIAFSSEWLQLGAGERFEELNSANREMTNEKNMFLTVVESLASPVFFIGLEGKLIYLNIAAARLINLPPGPGGFYYKRQGLEAALPSWIRRQHDLFSGGQSSEMVFEEKDSPDTEGRAYMGRIAVMEDVSGKYSGSVIIMNDITDRVRAEEKITAQRDELERALADIRRLRGILPICANCKKIRNDEGYWDQVEDYITDHSEAEFSHSLCPDCARELYPDYAGRIYEKDQEKKGV
jgi:PAS domain-containing protein